MGVEEGRGKKLYVREELLSFAILVKCWGSVDIIFIILDTWAMSYIYKVGQKVCSGLSATLQGNPK